MRWRWRSVVLAGWLTAMAGAAAAQAGWSIGGAALGVGSSPAFGGAGIAVVVPIGRELRMSGLGTLGTTGGRTAGRGEIALHVAAPAKPNAWGWFLGGGVAALVGPRSAGFVLATVGAERGVGRKGVVWLEGGVAGGPRVVIGYRVHPGRR